jgi:hypothetical protein
MNEQELYEEPRRGPSWLAILIAVLLLGILITMVSGLLMLRGAAQAVEGGAERVREWGAELLKEPTPTIRPNPATIIHEIRALSRLETVTYSIEKVVTAEKSRGGLADLLGLDERLLFIAHGQVIAGVDLSKLMVEDIVITDDNVVVLTLPPAEIFVATLDNEQSYVYDHQRGILNRVFTEQSDLETLVRRAAEETIRQAALEDGILTIATANAENTVRALLVGLGFAGVDFGDQPIEVPTAVPTVAPTVAPTPGG